MKVEISCPCEAGTISANVRKAKEYGAKIDDVYIEDLTLNCSNNCLDLSKEGDCDIAMELVYIHVNPVRK